MSDSPTFIAVSVTAAPECVPMVYGFGVASPDATCAAVWNTLLLLRDACND